MWKFVICKFHTLIINIRDSFFFISFLCFSCWLFSTESQSDNWKFWVWVRVRFSLPVKSGTGRSGSGSLRQQQPFATTICHDHSQPRYGSLGETLMSFLFESVTVLVCLFTENFGIWVPLKHWIKGLCAVSSILLGSFSSNLVLGRGQEHWEWDGLRSWDRVYRIIETR